MSLPREPSGLVLLLVVANPRILGERLPCCQRSRGSVQSLHQVCFASCPSLNPLSGVFTPRFLSSLFPPAFPPPSQPLASSEPWRMPCSLPFMGRSRALGD